MGADAATTSTTSGDILIGNLRVPKGVHTLYILPSEKGWKLILNSKLADGEPSAVKRRTLAGWT